MLKSLEKPSLTSPLDLNCLQPSSLSLLRSALGDGSDGEVS